MQILWDVCLRSSEVGACGLFLSSPEPTLSSAKAAVQLPPQQCTVYKCRRRRYGGHQAFGGRTKLLCGGLPEHLMPNAGHTLLDNIKFTSQLLLACAQSLYRVDVYARGLCYRALLHDGVNLLFVCVILEDAD